MPRVGKKRSDRRWKAEDGTIWASKFEYNVYEKLCRLGYVVRKCEKGTSDTFDYHTPVKSGQCPQCGCGEIVQRRTYTPDLFVYTTGGLDSQDPEGFYVETKGYFPGPKRSLLRAFAKERPDIVLCVIAERDNWVTKGKSKLSDYFSRYLKSVKFHVWDGTIPEEWIA